MNSKPAELLRKILFREPLILSFFFFLAKMIAGFKKNRRRNFFSSPEFAGSFYMQMSSVVVHFHFDMDKSRSALLLMISPVMRLLLNRNASPDSTPSSALASVRKHLSSCRSLISHDTSFVGIGIGISIPHPNTVPNA